MGRATVTNAVRANRMYHAAMVEELIQHPLPPKKRERFRRRHRSNLRLKDIKV